MFHFIEAQKSVIERRWKEKGKKRRMNRKQNAICDFCGSEKQKKKKFSQVCKNIQKEKAREKKRWQVRKTLQRTKQKGRNKTAKT